MVIGENEVLEINHEGDVTNLSNVRDTVNRNQETEFHFKEIRKGDLLKFITEDSDQEINGQVILRAGWWKE